MGVPFRAFPLALLAALAGSAGACSTPQAQPAAAVPPPAQSAGAKPAAGPALNFELIRIGGRIATSDCGACHAVDARSASPVAAAPPLRRLTAKYGHPHPPADLIAAVSASHGDMPVYQLDPSAAEALIAYMTLVGFAANGK